MERLCVVVFLCALTALAPASLVLETLPTLSEAGFETPSLSPAADALPIALLSADRLTAAAIFQLPPISDPVTTYTVMTAITGGSAAGRRHLLTAGLQAPAMTGRLANAEAALEEIKDRHNGFVLSIIESMMYTISSIGTIGDGSKSVLQCAAF